MLLCIQTSPRKPILTKSIRSVYVVLTGQQGEAGAVVPSAFANLQTLFDAVNCARLAYNTLVICMCTFHYVARSILMKLKLVVKVGMLVS